MRHSYGLCLAALLMSLAWVPPVQAGMAAPPQYRFAAPLVFPQGEEPDSRTLHVAPLPADILRLMRTDGADLRLLEKDEQGTFQEVPFVVLEDIRPRVPARNVELAVKEFRELDSEMVVELSRSDETPLDSLLVDTPNRNFDLPVMVEGSVDGKGWVELASSRIFDYSMRVDLRRTEIPLEGASHRFFRLHVGTDAGELPPGTELSLTYKELELTLSDLNQEPFRIAGVAGRAPSTEESRVTDSVIITDFTREERDHTTRLTFESRLPVEELALSVAGPYFHRRVAVIGMASEEDQGKLVAERVLYRIPGAGGGDAEELRMALDRRSHAFLRLEVDNGDNPPLAVEAVELSWPRRLLAFYPRSGTGSLVLGLGDPALEGTPPPRYELSSFVTESNWRTLEHRMLPAPRLEANELEPGMERPEQPAADSSQLFLYGVVGLAVLVLGVWLSRLAGTTRKEPNNEA